MALLAPAAMYGGIAAALLWSAWQAAVRHGRLRALHLGLAAASAGGFLALALGQMLASAAAGVALILLAPALLLDRTAGTRWPALVHLTWGLLLAAGVPLVLREAQ